MYNNAAGNICYLINPVSEQEKILNKPMFTDSGLLNCYMSNLPFVFDDNIVIPEDKLNHRFDDVISNHNPVYSMGMMNRQANAILHFRDGD